MKEWGGQRFNTDFEPIDEQGNVLGPKDQGASEGWTNANEPWRNSPGWHAQPLSAEQSAGLQQSNPAAWAAREQWRAMNPTTANGAPLGGGSTYGPPAGGGAGGSAPGSGGGFDWSGWDVGGGQQSGGGETANVTNTLGPMTVDPNTGQATHSGGTLSNTPGGYNRGIASPVLTAGSGGMAQAPQTGGPDPLPQGGGAYSWMSNLPPNYQSGRGNVQGQGEGQGGFGPSQFQSTEAPQVTAPTLSGGQYTAPQLDAPALLSQLGGAPQVAGAPPVSAFGADVQSSIQQGLGPATVNQNDPAYQAQLESFRRNEQRSADRQRASLAARANATGTLNSGGFDSQVRRVLSNQGANEADFESELMARELTAARDRQARAQGLGAGLLSQEQQQSLQERLANQGSTLQTMGYQNTRDLANQGAQMQTGLANQGATLQTQGLNSQRDLAQLQAQLQAGLANQGATLQQRGLDTQRYGIDTQNATSRYGIDTQNATNRYGIDTTRDTARQGLDLQSRLGNNDNVLRRNALMLQQQLGMGDLDLRRLGLTNQNSQYYAGLGQQLGLGQAQLNQEALLALLRG